MASDYLNTKETAKVLGVSDASVRRWSDAGLLASHRVGRRGERRFARSDVLALKSAGQQGRSGSAAEVFLEGTPIPLHGHLISFYTSDRGRLRLSLPFLRDGIVGGQACILLGNQQTARVYENELSAEGISMSRALETGQLQHVKRFRTADEGLETIELSLSGITRRGGLVIRVLGDAVQIRDGMRSTAEFFRFEDALTPLARRFPVIILCQYDVRLLGSVDVVSVLKTHADNFDLPLGMFLN